MATQRTANTHLLARDGSSSHPGHGHLAPAWGLSSCAWLPACRLPCAWPVFPWRVVVLVSRPLSSWLPRLLCAPAAAAHGGSPLWCPRGLALVSLCSLHLPSHLSLARCAFSAPFSGAPCPRPASCLVVMSCVSLQLSSRRWLRLRTPSRSAFPGSWAPLALVGPQPPPPPARPQPPQPAAAPSAAPSPSHEAAAGFAAHSGPHVSLLPGSLSLPFPCAAAQTCTVAQFQHRLRLAWLGRPR